MSVSSLRLLPGADHFHVDEQPAYLPGGSGEHLYVHIEKRGLTTDQVAEALARACGVRFDAVGYAGRKDRHAVTRQWFSVHFGQEGALANLAGHLGGRGTAQVLSVNKHSNKLRLGHLAGNRFVLGLAGSETEHAALAARLTALHHEGVPNRFGAQRFGIDRANVRVARAAADGDWSAAVGWLIDARGPWCPGQELPSGWRAGADGRVLGALRQKPDDCRGAWRAGGKQLARLIASAAQSACFNAVLDARAAAGLLHTLRVDDLALGPRGGSFRVSAEDLADVNARSAPGRLEVRGSGPLPGTMKLEPGPGPAAEERAWMAVTGFAPEDFVTGALESHGERRALVVALPAAPVLAAWGEPSFALELLLPPGCYATEVLAAAGVEVPADRAGSDQPDAPNP